MPETYIFSARYLGVDSINMAEKMVEEARKYIKRLDDTGHVIHLCSLDISHINTPIVHLTVKGNDSASIIKGLFIYLHENGFRWEEVIKRIDIPRY